MEYGAKAGYPRLKKHFGKLAAYIQLLRVFTGIAPLLAGMFGTLASVNSPISFEHIKVAIYVGVTLMLAQFTGQIINQHADYKLDASMPEKRNRPIPSGSISREEALGLAWLLAMFAIARAFTISTFFGLITLTLIFFAVFYSMSPFSPRRVHPLLNTGWMAISRGFLPVLAVWSVFGNLNKAWPYSILMFLWVRGFQATKDVFDIEGDREFNIKTLPNTYGLKGLTVTMVTCTAAYTVLANSFNMPIMLLILPLAAVAILTTKRQSALTENTISWIAFYISLGLIYVLMFINEKLSFSL